MNRIATAFAAFLLFLGGASAMAQTTPTLSTDKPIYAPGETITFTGTNWAPGEQVTIVMGSEGSSSDQTTIQTTADVYGAFTISATMPDADGTNGVGAAGKTGRPVIPNVSQNANFHAIANGAISHGQALAQFSEGETDTDGARLLDLENYWENRLTFPTGKFDPDWVRKAAKQDKNVPKGTPKGRKRGHNSVTGLSLNGAISVLTLSDSAFTALGPQPERMTGCTGCFDYTTTQGRVNTIAIDPTTTTSGSIVAYVGSVGGGVWKTTNCCSAGTTWTVVTDDPLIGTTGIDSVTIDPNDHNTIYAGTGDLNYGSFSMGSQGVLKSTDAGAHWTVLGSDKFGAALDEPAGQFPQYNAVGKVRVDPNNSNRVVAGTKSGIYVSYDGGTNWTGPCVTNTFGTMRQDITGLELTNMGGGVTRILAAVGVRGFATTVQFNLGQNGANGIYSATMPTSGCPSFSSIASNTNGFLFGTAVTGSPYLTGANMNAGSGNIFVNTTTGNQLGRVDIAVAPSNSNVIYAQVQSIAANSNAGCGTANGCQLGVWASTNGGTSWTFMAGSAGGSLRNCAGGNTSGNPGDYPQNWYDQGMAVDPNNADRLFIDTYDTWFATRTGTAFFNITCGYNGGAAANHVVHVDHHALAFVPGSSNILLEGSDGGIFSSSNANTTTASVRPTWVNMDTGLNTIEFYSGDISGNFANSSAPAASGGAQDNGPSSVLFAGSPTGPVQWQMGLGGDGFYSRIDPVGTGTSLRFWQGNNSGGLSRCIGLTPCTNGGATWNSKQGGWTGDTQSFILPFDLFHGGLPGGDDCPAAAANGGCGHLIAATTRVWETVTGNSANTNGTVTWYVTNSPATQNMTKQSLGNRSFINQVKYSPRKQNIAIVGTNDANVWIGFNLGTGVAGQASWVNVTGGNSVLPLRPVLGIALDPSTTTSPIGYAAVGGFNANTPATPGHVFRVVCNANCASSTWTDKSGNLPDIPVDSIIANPNFPPQVFAGSDFGLYYTDDITASTPVWQRFSNLPAVMIWDMQIDRGATALSLWTRSRGAYAWPLTLGPENPLPTVLTVGAASGTYGGTVSLTATLTTGGNPIPGKTLTFTLNGNAVGSAVTDGSGTATVSAASLASINAGSYPAGTAASYAGDDIYAAASDTEALTVSPKAISVTAVADSKTYDGTTSSTATPTITPGIVAGDTANFIETFDNRNAGGSKTLTPSGFVSDGNSGNNYSVSFFNNTSGNISAKGLTGSITADSKQYDGNSSATIATRALSGIIAPDVVTYVGGTATFSDKNFGTGKTVTATGLSLSGADSGNYSVNSTATTTADITARPLTITATGINKPYDGNTTATVTLSDNRVPGDVFTDSYASASFADKNIGTNKPVSVVGISISGTDAGNYTFNTTASTTASISAKVLTISATGVNKIYDGTTSAAVLLSDNRVPGDVFTDSYASAVFADKDVATGKVVTVAGISISGPDAGDYSFNTGATTTADITKATLTVTANNTSRLYSYPNPPFSASYSGFQNGETLATSGVTGTPSLTTTATQFSAIGTYTITTALGTLSSGNYQFVFVNGTLTVYLSGMVGVDSATIGSNKAVADSFDSSGGYPATQGSNLTILSNGTIDIRGAKISGNLVSSQGNVLLGPGSTVSGNVTAGGSISNQGTVGGTSTPNLPSALIVANAVPNCGAFTSNPDITGGRYTYANGDLSVNGNSTITLANGSYCFHSLTLTGQSTVQVSGPVVINMTGVLNASGGSFVNTTQIPSNLQIASSFAGADGASISGGTNAYLTLYAPGTNVTVTGGSPVFGALLGKTLTVSGNSEVHYDIRLPQIWAGFGF